MSGRQRQQATAPWGPSNPQALNRYSYVNNNPLRYADPSGHEEAKGVPRDVGGTGEVGYAMNCSSYTSTGKCVPVERTNADGSREWEYTVWYQDDTGYHQKTVWSGDRAFEQFKRHVDGYDDNINDLTIVIIGVMGAAGGAIAACFLTAGLGCIATLGAAILAIPIIAWYYYQAERSRDAAIDWFWVI